MYPTRTTFAAVAAAPPAHAVPTRSIKEKYVARGRKNIATLVTASLIYTLLLRVGMIVAVSVHSSAAPKGRPSKLTRKEEHLAVLRCQVSASVSDRTAQHSEGQVCRHWRLLPALILTSSAVVARLELFAVNLSEGGMTG